MDLIAFLSSVAIWGNFHDRWTSCLPPRKRIVCAWDTHLHRGINFPDVFSFWCCSSTFIALWNERLACPSACTHIHSGWWGSPKFWWVLIFGREQGKRFGDDSNLSWFILHDAWHNVGENVIFWYIKMEEIWPNQWVNWFFALLKYINWLFNYNTSRYL